MQNLYQIQKSRLGILFLLSGPAGSGKSTLLKRALEEFDNMKTDIKQLKDNMVEMKTLLNKIANGW